LATKFQIFKLSLSTEDKLIALLVLWGLSKREDKKQKM